jgi:Spy/CpxP family protein refolding chaperone
VADGLAWQAGLNLYLEKAFWSGQPPYLYYQKVGLFSVKKCKGVLDDVYKTLPILTSILMQLQIYRRKRKDENRVTLIRLIKEERPMKSHLVTGKKFGFLVCMALILTLALGQVSTGVQAVTIEEELPLLEDGAYFKNCRWARIMAYLLGLTDTQKQEIQSIIDSERSAFEPLVNQLARFRRELWVMHQGQGFDEAAVREIASQQSKTIAELIVIKNRISFQVFELLTPEQKMEAERLRNLAQRRIQNCLSLKWVAQD